jgi:PilC-like protein with beta-propeller domain
MQRKLNHIFICAAAIFCLFLVAPGQVLGSYSGTIDDRLSDHDDDAEEYDDSGTLKMSTDSSDIDMTYDSSWAGTHMTKIGLRFQDLDIPQGATITNAYLQFRSKESDTAATSLTIWGEASDDAGSFDTGKGNIQVVDGDPEEISSRAKTAASVAWTVPRWNNNNWYQSPDISTIVQEIVDRTGWGEGNDMAFIIEGFGERVAKSRNDSDWGAPRLHVEYTSTVVEVSVSSDNDDAEEKNNGDMDRSSDDLDMFQDYVGKVGLRFRNIQVPRYAVITSAYIRFEADESDSSSASMTIHGHDTNDANEFDWRDDDISNRTTTSSSVNWNSISSWNSGRHYNTPDLSAIVQEIVGRPGWSSGNDMAFIFSDVSGTRVAESREGNGDQPKLHIEYTENATPTSFITLSETGLGASAYVGSSPASQTFTITNTGTGTMTFSLDEDAVEGDVDWITLPVTAGTLAPGASRMITVIFTAQALSEGTYTATITVTDANATNSPVELSVSVTESALPAGATCGHVPVYTENLVSPAIMIELDVSGSMGSDMPVSNPENDPTTPDLSTIVQEIVDRTGWASGNAMAFILTGSGERVSYSYDGGAGVAPMLHVAYTKDSVNYDLDIRVNKSSDDAEEQTDNDMEVDNSDLDMFKTSSRSGTTYYTAIGLRFQDVTIPAGATITNAYLQFVVRESDTATTSMTIYGEDLDNPPTFASNDGNITDREKTTAAVAWSSVPNWNASTLQERMEIAQDALSDLVKDRGISWGFGTWTSSSTHGYTSGIDYTKIHDGCKLHDAAHQASLQASIAAATPLSYTPLAPALKAGYEYFRANKKDDEGSGAYYDTSVSCQPRFLIVVTDGLGNTDTTLASVEANTNLLIGEEVTVIAVGFGIDDATQLQKIAQLSNAAGKTSETDDLYALHEEVSGVGQPFLANNKDDLVDALSTITESVKAAVFHGSAPAPTTSADLGDTVLVANFDATDWSGDLEAVVQASDGEWDVVSWAASGNLPGTRKVFTIDPSDHTTEIPYTDGTLTGDNWDIWDSATSCGSSNKKLGDIINSTPIVVGSPSYYYPFDNYTTWKNSTSRDTIIYIGANDGALHAFNLADGSEKWAFVPEVLHAKLMMATDSTFDMCSSDYCHQYFVDGSPQAGDIFDGTDWKTIVVTGLGEGGEAYFALDVTSGEPFDHASDPAAFLWEYTDTELGETWTAASIARVQDGSDEAWGVFFGSGYSTTDQANKQAYLYGIVADSAAEMWNDGSGDTDHILVSASGATGTLEFYTKTGDFTVGEVVTGASSGAFGTITAVNADSLGLQNIFGTFVEDETIADPVTGAALVYVPLEGAKLDDALASPLLADLDADYIEDHLYVGNLYGIMYRVKNIGKGQTPTVSKLLNFSPVKTSNDENPIRAQAAFAYQAVADNVWVYFGTGRYESQADKTTMTQQYFFGLKDSLTSTDEYTYKVGTGLQLNGSDLVTLDADYVTDDASGTEVRIITGSNPSGDSWAVKLDNTSLGMGGSERVIVKPLVAGGIVFFTTFIPDQNICAGNGDTWVYALDYATGEAPSDPVFDLNQDGVVDDQDKAEDSEGNVYNVAAVSVGGGQGSNPVLYKKTLFITTTGEGLEGLDVDVGDINVQLGSWKEKL